MFHAIGFWNQEVFPGGKQVGRALRIGALSSCSSEGPCEDWGTQPGSISEPSGSLEAEKQKRDQRQGASLRVICSQEHRELWGSPEDSKAVAMLEHFSMLGLGQRDVCFLVSVSFS